MKAKLIKNWKKTKDKTVPKGTVIDVTKDKYQELQESGHVGPYDSSLEDWPADRHEGKPSPAPAAEKSK
jgi:hypothetical protein